MPRVNWGVSARDIDNFDREAQYKPYDGPIPRNGVYRWKVKKLQYVAATREKNPQLRIGLELIPRKGRKEERAYKGFFVMLFPPVTDRTQFRYVPFLDAIGVSASDFEKRTLADEEGNIKSIGKWRNDGQQIIKGELKDDQDQNGNPRKDIGWMGADDGETSDADEEEFDEDDDEAGDYDEEDYEDGEYDEDEDDF